MFSGSMDFAGVLIVRGLWRFVVGGRRWRSVTPNSEPHLLNSLP